MKVGSLFSGIGGFELAAEWMGWETIWQSEVDPYCVALLAERFPKAKQLGDITRIDWSTVERPDIICGGFPCQDISIAGKGAGLAGGRSGLWFEFARCVRELGPRYVVVENVRRLLTIHAGRDFGTVLGALADLGYNVEWSMHGAADVGAPHKRDRIWLLAYRDAGLGKRTHGTLRAGRDATHDRSEGLVDATGRGWRAGREQPARRFDGGRAGLVDAECERGRSRHGQREDAGNAHAPGEAVGWSDAVPVRGYDGTVRLIPREAAEKGIESSVFPVADGLPGRVARLRGIGNAIVPACALPVYRRIAEIEGGLMSPAPIPERSANDGE